MTNQLTVCCLVAALAGSSVVAYNPLRPGMSSNSSPLVGSPLCPDGVTLKRPAEVDAVFAKLDKLRLSQKDVDAAVAWARSCKTEAALNRNVLISAYTGGTA